MTIFHRIKIKREPEIFAECELCGQPIWKETDLLEGERDVELTEDYYVHVDCMPEWIRQNEKTAR